VNPTDRPKLRPVEAFPVEAQGKKGIALRDPAGFTDAVLVLPPLLLDIVSLFDGEHSIADIQAAVMRRHGELLPREQIQAVYDTGGSSGWYLWSPANTYDAAALEK